MNWRDLIAVHPAAEAFDLLEGDDLAGLVADIKKNGIVTPITLLKVGDGYEVLDGRNRLTAAEIAGVDLFRPDGKPIWKHFNPVGGDSKFDPFAFVVSVNIKRRHLNESQRAMVAAKLANMRQGSRTDLQPSAHVREVSQPDAAKMLNVSVRSVQNAAAVVREASPELVKQVERGEVSVSKAAKEIKQSKKPLLPKMQQLRKMREAQNGKSLAPPIVSERQQADEVLKLLQHIEREFQGLNIEAAARGLARQREDAQAAVERCQKWLRSVSFELFADSHRIVRGAQP